jgi:hypothetical protein
LPIPDLLDSTFPCLEEKDVFVPGDALVLRPELLTHVLNLCNKALEDGFPAKKLVTDTRTDKDRWASPAQFTKNVLKGKLKPVDNEGNPLSWDRHFETNTRSQVQSRRDGRPYTTLVSAHDLMAENDASGVGELVPGLDERRHKSDHVTGPACSSRGSGLPAPRRSLALAIQDGARRNLVEEVGSESDESFGMDLFG